MVWVSAEILETLIEAYACMCAETQRRATQRRAAQSRRLPVDCGVRLYGLPGKRQWHISRSLLFFFFFLRNRFLETTKCLVTAERCGLQVQRLFKMTFFFQMYHTVKVITFQSVGCFPSEDKRLTDLRFMDTLGFSKWNNHSPFQLMLKRTFHFSRVKWS